MLNLSLRASSQRQKIQIKQINSKTNRRPNLEIALKQKIEAPIKIFHEMYKEFISKKIKLDLECHNHFQELRYQLDLHRDKQMTFR